MDAGVVGTASVCATRPGDGADGGVHAGETLAALETIGADGSRRSLSDRLGPCDDARHLLIVRAMNAWSGTSQWHAAHTARVRGAVPGVRVIDLLVRNRFDAPPSAADLDAWRARYDTPPDLLLIEPTYALADAAGPGVFDPVLAWVDARTLRTLRTASMPRADTIDAITARTLAQVEGRTPPSVPAPVLHDGRFSDDAWDLVQGMSPVPPAPRDPTNAAWGLPTAIAWGRALFVDSNLSIDGTVSCAGCHEPTRAFQDGRATGRGLAVVDRNTPSVLPSPWLRWQFWDGRADTLWAQALGPMEADKEMGSNRLRIVQYVKRVHRRSYEEIFGPMPDLDDPARFPNEGRPGTPAWDAMRPADRDAVNRVYANIGKAIAAYEASLPQPRTPFDAYVAGNQDALTPGQRDGLRLFYESGCMQCHHGPMLEDGAFHAVGFGSGRLDGMPDRGRAAAIDAIRGSVFNADGPFSDAPGSGPLRGFVEDPVRDLGRFRTAPLRGVADSAPYGHGGTFDTLEAVVSHYAHGGAGPGGPQVSTGTFDTHLARFHGDDRTIGALADFLRALSLAVPPLHEGTSSDAGTADAH